MWLRGVSDHPHPVTFLLLCPRTENTKNPYKHFISADLGVRDNNSVNWTVTIPEGWYVVISVEDASGEDGWSEPVRIHPHSYLAIVSTSHWHTLCTFISPPSKILVQASDNTSCLPPELAYLAEHP